MEIKDINKIYDKFPPEGKNMTRSEFVRQVQELTDPTRMQTDLAEIELRKARERSARINIERGL